ncbi:MAG: sporulation initiation factor Spo0A C-terminal domain-containing protein [Candidatus Caccovivens sp.]
MDDNEISAMRREIKLAFMRAGIRCDLVGFSYLCYAVELVIEEPELINCLCKNLYVRISQRFNVKNDNCVERSIRHAIDQTASTKTFKGLNEMFGVEIYKKGERPTSGELIRLIAEYYQLGMYKDV